MEWKLPIFGLECIQFQFMSTDQMVGVMDDRVLEQVLAQVLAQFHPSQSASPTHQSSCEQRHKEGKDNPE